MTSKNFVRLCLLSLVLLAPCGMARADVLLFRDTFTVSANSFDVNFEFNAPGRQSGTVAPLMYSQNPGGADFRHQVGNGGSPGQLLIASSGGDGRVSPNFNFIQNPGLGNALRIGFDVDPVNPTVSPGGVVQTSWAAVVFGTTNQGTGNGSLAFVNSTDGVGLLVRGNGDFQAFNGNALVGQGATGVGAGLHHIDVDIRDLGDGNPFDGVGTASIAAFINGGSTPFFSFTRPAFTSNFIGLQGNSDNGVTTGHDFDNFAVTLVQQEAAVPEPATLAVFGLLGVGGLVARRRKLARP